MVLFGTDFTLTVSSINLMFYTLLFTSCEGAFDADTFRDNTGLLWKVQQTMLHDKYCNNADKTFPVLSTTLPFLMIMQKRAFLVTNQTVVEMREKILTILLNLNNWP